MNCHDIEPLLLAERDGVLTNEQHAALARHVATCPACRQLRARLNAALDTLKADAALVTVPDAEGEWRELRAQLVGAPARPAKKRPLAPVIWFGAPLAAAAAIALVFFSSRPTPQPTVALPVVAETARADYVEAGDANASTMVYVDKDSGWLVVWATDVTPKSSG